jgi:hypothetical protein
MGSGVRQMSPEAIQAVLAYRFRRLFAERVGSPRLVGSEGAHQSMPPPLDHRARTVLVDGPALEGRDLLAGQTVVVPRTTPLTVLLITAWRLRKRETAGISGPCIECWR